MEYINEMKKIAIENLDSDIKILALRCRLKKDTNLIETIISEKLDLLYYMDIINMKTYHTYILTIKALKED